MAPGARRGAQGAENRPKTRGQIYNFILPKVCPIFLPGRGPGPPKNSGLGGPESGIPGPGIALIFLVGAGERVPGPAGRGGGPLRLPA